MSDSNGKGKKATAPEFFVDDGMRERPPQNWLDAPSMSPSARTAVIDFYKRLLPSAVRVLEAGSKTEALDAFQRLPSRFPLIAPGSGRLLGEVTLYWDGDLMGDVLEAAATIEHLPEVRQSGTEEFVPWLFMAILINEAIQRTQAVMSEALDGVFVEAALSASTQIAKLNGGQVLSKEKEQWIQEICSDRAKAFRAKFSRGGKVGRLPRDVRAEFNEFVTAVRQWEGDVPPTEIELAAKLPSLKSSTSLAGTDKRAYDKKARGKLRARLQAFKKEGLCPKVDWPGPFIRVREGCPE